MATLLAQFATLVSPRLCWDLYSELKRLHFLTFSLFGLYEVVTFEFGWKVKLAGFL